MDQTQTTLRTCMLAALGAALLGAAPFAAASDDSMRCGSRLVHTGDPKDKVLALCGEPSSRAITGYVRGPAFVDGPYDYSWFGPTWVDMPVETWTYNFGSNKLLRRLRFIGDELKEIRTDGYGY
jgi:hypothetical protein